MKQALRLVILLACVWPVVPAASPDQGALSGQNLDLQLEYRALQPGDVIKIKLLGKVPIKKAHLRFSGEKSMLWEDERTGEFLAFLGLDLNIQPGNFPLVVTAQMGDGTLDTVRKEILVTSKEFPIERLRVEEKFVTPPAEVLERIRLEAELTRSIYAGRSPDWLGEGGFVLPTDGRVNPNFGRRRIFNDQPRSPHSGVDISSAHGTPVKASNSGRVVLAHGLYYAGNTVVIDHGLGVFSIYLHFSRMLVEEGEFVRKGESIGEVGATGRVTGPHLHWSVRIRGSRVDPLSLLDLRMD
jgi:murein DD-endopeptidase MepM/ murein hydrolase activator NlpD